MAAAAAAGTEGASPPAPHGLSLSPLRCLRRRIWHRGHLRARGGLRAVPGRLRLPLRHPGGEEAGRPGAGPRRGGRGGGRPPAVLMVPPPLAEDPLPEHRALHRVSAAGGRAGGGDLPRLRRGHLPGGCGGSRKAAGERVRFPGEPFPLPAQVTIVGIIRHAEKAPTNILYKVDDMTAAPMDVRQWVDTDEAGGENVVVPPGTYIKVAGHLRSFQTNKSLVAFKIMPLENMNEFTAHMLEVVNAHMSLRRNLMSVSRAPQSFSSAGISDVGGYGGGGSFPVNGLTAHQSQVLNLIKNCPIPEGMSLQELKVQLHNMSMSTIKQAVDFLSSEGHIYSTVDDDHYKSTDAE
uniref:Replication factor A protein 2 n=1 Tax=Calidris pygmaea TaxID=425635 RepID=A0A8C3PHF0_9CHAR